MLSLSGNRNNVSTIGRTESVHRTPSIYKGFCVAGCLAMSAYAFAPVNIGIHQNFGTRIDYEYGDMGIITMTDRQKIRQKVIEMVIEEHGFPAFIANIETAFRNIEKVKDVIVKRNSEQAISFIVLVDMPIYDDALTDELIDIEMTADDSARKHGYRLKYLHLPTQHVGDLSSLDVDRIV